MSELEIYKLKAEQETKARKELETLVENKNRELLQAHEDYQENYRKLQAEINERKRVEEELHTSKKSMLLATLLYENISEAMTVTDGDSIVLSVNPAFTRITGYSLEEVIGKTPKMLKSWKHLNNSEHWQGEIWNRRKNGEIYPEWLSINTIFNEDGTPYRRVAIFSDITERKRAEETLHELFQKQLETNQELSEKTRALDQAYQQLQQNMQQLQEAQAQLVQSEKMAGLGTLVAGVAHEINNPVNFVHLGTHNLKEGISKQKQFLLPLLEEEPTILDILKQQYLQFDNSLENIEEGCIRIKTIVEDLRTFSRLDEADRKVVNLIASLESTIRITQTQYQKTVQIVTDFTAQPKLECWSAKLNQVFMNVIVNACHAIEKQQLEANAPTPGTLYISSFETESNGRKELAIVFQDNGCGMSGEVKNKMFEPFFTTKPVGQGTGLGMSISYRIIQDHKGRIEVESLVGQGTTITLYLPL